MLYKKMLKNFSGEMIDFYLSNFIRVFWFFIGLFLNLW